MRVVQRCLSSDRKRRFGETAAARQMSSGCRPRGDGDRCIQRRPRHLCHGGVAGSAQEQGTARERRRRPNLRRLFARISLGGGGRCTLTLPPRLLLKQRRRNGTDARQQAELQQTDRTRLPHGMLVDSHNLVRCRQRLQIAQPEPQRRPARRFRAALGTVRRRGLRALIESGGCRTVPVGRAPVAARMQIDVFRAYEDLEGDDPIVVAPNGCHHPVAPEDLVQLCHPLGLPRLLLLGSA